MPSALVFFNELSDVPSKAQRELLTLASRFDQSTLAVASEVSQDAQNVVANYGLSKLFVAPSQGDVFVDHALSVLEAAVKQSAADVVLVANDNFNREVAARIAVRLDSAVITDAIDVATDLVVTKDELAGSYSAQAQSTGGTLFVSVKPNSIDDDPQSSGQQLEVQALEIQSAMAAQVRVVATEAKAVSDRPKLTEARVVVAGGRGVNGDFGPVEDLADALAGAVGASRAATDAGWITHDAQIGQTGVTVSPQLFISAGISGAIQQKAGMQTSKCIVAINKDVDAPVFEIADFGIVGDLSKVLPQAAEEIRRRQA